MLACAAALRQGGGGGGWREVSPMDDGGDGGGEHVVVGGCRRAEKAVWYVCGRPPPREDGEASGLVDVRRTRRDVMMWRGPRVCYVLEVALERALDPVGGEPIVRVLVLRCVLARRSGLCEGVSAALSTSACFLCSEDRV